MVIMEFRRVLWRFIVLIKVDIKNFDMVFST